MEDAFKPGRVHMEVKATPNNSPVVQTLNEQFPL